MAVFCSKCGEELLGAVNRCWRCGHVFDAVPEEGGLPPVRRPATAPNDLGAPLVVAEIVPPGGTCAPIPSGGARRPAAEEPLGGTEVPSIGRDAAAVTALTLGIISLPTSLFTCWSLVPAIVGLVLGIQGLRRTRRRTALIGLVLCCIALSFGLIRSVVHWHTQYDLQRQRDLYGDEF